MAFLQNFNNLRIINRNVESAPPIVARSDGKGAHGDFSGGNNLLGENAIDDFVVGAIAAHGDELAVALLNNGVADNFDGMTWIFGQNIIEFKSLFYK